MKFTLPTLPYAYNALEPYIEQRTMEIHHQKHHQTYVNKLNLALEKHPNLPEQSLENLLRNLAEVPSDIRTAVKNHGGGHFNHSFFWSVLGKNAAGAEAGKPMGECAAALKKDFGDFKNFSEEFTRVASSHFGSGWAWLTLDHATGKLECWSSHDQDCPLSVSKDPLLTLDLWEHAYYLQYQNRRDEFISAFWHIVNWDEVTRKLKRAQEGRR